MGRFVTRVAALTAVIVGLTAATASAQGRVATVVRAGTGAADRGIQRPQFATRQADGEDPHDHDDKCSSSACVRNWKLGFIAVLFVEGIIGGLVPYGLKYLPRFDLALHLANVFSGGIFIATGMLHILPEALELLDGVSHDGGEEHNEEPSGGEAGGEEHHDEHEPSFPTAYACAMAFFFALLLVEHLLLRRFAGAYGHTALIELAAGDDEKKSHASHPAVDADAPARKDIMDAAVGADATVKGLDDGDGDASADALDAEAKTQTHAGDIERTSDGDEARPDSSGDESEQLRRQMVAASNKRFFSSNFFRALLAIVGVSLHSVFESLSLGLASDFSSALSVFIAIAAHKWATSIALGVKCEKEHLRLGQFVSLIFLFAAVTPLAAGLGLLIDNVNTTVRGVLFALSAGIFLYIGAFEVPSEEFMVHQRWLWRKYFAYASGAIVITVITAILVATDVH